MAQKFNINDYTPVEERLNQYREDHPDYRISTEILEYSTDDKVVIKATLFINAEQQSAGLYHTTGIAEETPEGYVNKTSRVENCETSAIGRALANVGYTGKGGRPSREEMAKVERLSNAPSKKAKEKIEKTQTDETESDAGDETSTTDTMSSDNGYADYIAKIKTFKEKSELVKWFNSEVLKDIDPDEEPKLRKVLMPEITNAMKTLS